jgi:predicted transcriptional regulator
MMGRRITLELSDDILNRAEQLAVLSRRDVSEVLAQALSAALPPLDAVLGERRPVSELSDEEVLRQSKLRLTPAQDDRLSELLDEQQSGTLTEPQQTELLALMQVYAANWLRQAEALAEAVRRGLREPLSP